MRILVKAHKRKGRVVRAHGRIKKENRLKSKGQELVQAIELSMQGGHEDMQDVLKSLRLQNKINSSRDGYTALYNKVKEYRKAEGWPQEKIDRSAKYLMDSIKHLSKEEKKAGRIALKQDLNSNFPYSFKRKKK